MKSVLAFIAVLGLSNGLNAADTDKFSPSADDWGSLFQGVKQEVVNLMEIGRKNGAAGGERMKADNDALKTAVQGKTFDWKLKVLQITDKWIEFGGPLHIRIGPRQGDIPASMAAKLSNGDLIDAKVKVISMTIYNERSAGPSAYDWKTQVGEIHWTIGGTSGTYTSLPLPKKKGR
jgi:hypothetical protein